MGSLFGLIFKVIALVLSGILFVLSIVLLLSILPILIPHTDALFTPFHGVIFFSLPAILKLVFADYYSVQLGFWVLSALLVLPLLYLLIAAIGHLFNIRQELSGLRKALSILWLVALVTGLFFGVTTINTFEYKSSGMVNNIPAAVTGDTLYVKLSDAAPLPPLSIDEAELFDAFNRQFFLTKSDSLYFSTPLFSRSRTRHDEDSGVRINYYARGKSKQRAAQRMSSLSYNTTFSGDTLLLRPFFHFSAKDHWRAQRVRVLLCLPERINIKVLENKALSSDFYRQIEQELRDEWEW